MVVNIVKTEFLKNSLLFKGKFVSILLLQMQAVPLLMNWHLITLFTSASIFSLWMPSKVILMNQHCLLLRLVPLLR